VKIAFLADLHIANHRAHGGPVLSGINRRARICLDTLQRAVDRAVAKQCSALFILGDVFDTVKPEPQVVAEVQRILDIDELAIVVVEGNHDQVSTDPGDHSLGPLEPLVTLVEKPLLWTEVHSTGPGDQALVAAVPFEPGPAVEWLPKRVKELMANRPDTKAPLLLATHVGISDHDTESFMKATHDQVPAHLLGELAAEHKIALVMSGNWHQHKVFNLAAPGFPKAVQVGTLCPTGWDNPGLRDHGTMPIWDVATGKLEVEAIPGPRFLNLNGLENAPPEWHDALQLRGVPYGTTPVPTEPNGWHLYLHVKTTAEKLASEQGWVADLKARGVLEGGEVLIDDAENRAQARTAATVARSAETLSTALHGYVKEMPLPEGVDRAEVLARAQGFLAGSK